MKRSLWELLIHLSIVPTLVSLPESSQHFLKYRFQELVINIVIQWI